MSKQIAIVNLSMLHNIESIFTTVLPAFARVCTQYSSGCLSMCPVSLFNYSNYAYVLMKFYQHQALIDQYKLGELDTSSFLDHLIDILGLDLKHGRKVLKDELRNSWNTIIGNLYSDAFITINEIAKDYDKVIFVSFTNEMHVNYLLQQILQKQFNFTLNTKIVTSTKSMMGEPITENQPRSLTHLEIRENMFIVPSYLNFMKKTPDLIRAVIEHCKHHDEETSFTLYSQFKEDRDCAFTLNIDGVYSYLNDAIKLKAS